MININDLSVEFGAQVLIKNLGMQFNEGQRYGLVGANGSGKSTLLRIMSGQEPGFADHVSMPRGARIGFLKQDHFKYEKTRVVDVTLQGNEGLWSAMMEKSALMEHDSEEAGLKIAELEDLIAAHDGYAAEAAACKLLSGLGVPDDKHFSNMSELSGGYKLRVLLAQVLFAEPEILLLDEPTNHLDILSIAWLEDHLSRQFKGTLMVVSHDRNFLNRTCTMIADVDYETVTTYTGNYDDFMESKMLAMEQRLKETANLERKAAEIQSFVDRFRAKATKARQAQSRVKQLQKIELPIIKQTSRRYPRLNFQQADRPGKSILSVKGLSKSYEDNQVLKDVDLQVERGDKIAVIGPNGIGKSTLLKLLVEDLKPDAGTLEWKPAVNWSYFAQDHSQVLKEKDGKMSVYDWLYQFSPAAPIGEIRGILGQVLFSGDDVKKQLRSLSGGESARLMLGRIMLAKPNCMLLDEPTNHLDLESITALEDALVNYEGTVILVSHDRDFVSNMATRILELLPDGYRDYQGGYNEYLEDFGADHLDPRLAREAKKKKAAGGKGKEGHEARKAASRKKEKLEKKVSKLESDVSLKEEQLAEVEKKLSDPDFYAVTPQSEAIALGNKKEHLGKELEKLVADWEEAQKSLEKLA